MWHDFVSATKVYQNAPNPEAYKALLSAPGSPGNMELLSMPSGEMQVPQESASRCHIADGSFCNQLPQA
jgi:hypothetical protein